MKVVLLFKWPFPDSGNVLAVRLALIQMPLRPFWINTGWVATATPPYLESFSTFFALQVIFFFYHFHLYSLNFSVHQNSR